MYQTNETASATWVGKVRIRGLLLVGENRSSDAKSIDSGISVNKAVSQTFFRRQVPRCRSKTTHKHTQGARRYFTSNYLDDDAPAAIVFGGGRCELTAEQSERRTPTDRSSVKRIRKPR